MSLLKLIPFLFKNFFKNLRAGKLLVELPSGEKFLIEGKTSKNINATLRVKSYKLLPLLLFKGGLGAGESYIKGCWTASDLTQILKMAALNRESLSNQLMGYSAAKFFDRLLHFFRHNSLGRAKKNISYHYDLGNNFYSEWLDESMTYSSAIFESRESTLNEAQENKYKKLCELVKLSSNDNVLEIGCGWGGLINFIKRKYSCKMKAITISDEQFNFITNKDNEFKQPSETIVEFCDYRNLKGKFDKILSIEMVEAVGAKYWPDYFGTLKRCLKDGGTIGLQAITIKEEYYEDYRKGTDFIQRYIFPGGMLPSLNIIKTISRRAGLRVIKNSDYGQHYARTLKVWRERFNNSWPVLEKQGFDNRFYRTWDYYLAYCQAGFSQGMINVWQLSLEHDD